ncbi:protein-export chaperone SecB [Acidihalobacter prosperus]
MSETNNTEAEQQFGLQKIYLKDLSFESPEAPQVFTRDWSPEVEVQLQVMHQQLDDTNWEVELQVTVTAKVGEQVVYLVEIKQAGVFTLENIPEEHQGHLLGSYCPNLLFPFAREAVSDLVTKGGFPQLLLAPINFDALYMQQLEQQGGEQPQPVISH